MSDKPTDQKTDQLIDESLGLEHLPQSELEALPGSGEPQIPHLNDDDMRIDRTKDTSSNYEKEKD